MHRFLGLLSLLLAACAAPSPHFKSSPATRIVVDQTVFDVRVRGELAEAVRRNAQYAPRFGPLRAQAGFAMAQVSGCKVLTVTGDQAVALGTLDCDGQPRLWPLPARGTYSCIEIGQWVNEGPGPDYWEFECDPI